MTIAPARSPGRVTLAGLSERGRARAATALLGPAFVAAVAYVDPGNFAANFAAGAQHGYLLVWVIVLANLAAMLVQYVSASTGLITGHSLPELCRLRFGRRANLVLWLQAEVIAMATDLAEFTGAAVGLHLLFGFPLLPAGLITAVAAFWILALEQRGYRQFELAVMALLALVGVGFGYLFFAAGGQSWTGLAHGLVPRLAGGDTAVVAAGIVGATIMPHVIYLHSELQKDRVAASGRPGRRRLLAFNRLDCLIGLGGTGLINVAMLCVAAVLFHRAGAPAVTGLTAVHARLGALAGGAAMLLFAVALAASGLSSASVGTYAGQVVMAGFMNWRIPLAARRALTMLPSLLVLALASGVSQILIYSQVILSFGIPFALVPLLIVARDPAMAGAPASRRLTSTLLAAVTALVTALNAFLIYRLFASPGR